LFSGIDVFDGAVLSHAQRGIHSSGSERVEATG
jgi:hypothetical protein